MLKRVSRLTFPRNFQKRNIKGLPFKVTEEDAKKATVGEKISTTCTKHYIPFWRFAIPEHVKVTVHLGSGKYETYQFLCDSQFNFYASEVFDRADMNKLNPDFANAEKLQKSPDIQLNLYCIDQATAWKLSQGDIMETVTRRCKEYLESTGVTVYTIRDLKFDHVGTMYYLAVWEITAYTGWWRSRRGVNNYFVNGYSGFKREVQHPYVWTTNLFIMFWMLLEMGFLSPPPWMYTYIVGFLAVFAKEAYYALKKSRQDMKFQSSFDRQAAAEKSHEERRLKKEVSAKKRAAERNSRNAQRTTYDHTEYSGTYKGTQSSSSTNSRSGNTQGNNTNAGSSRSKTDSKSSSTSGSREYGRSNVKKEKEKSYDFANFDSYTLLGLTKGGSYSQPDIKAAFLKEAKKWHPDLCRNPQEKGYYTERFKAINQAYMALRK
jgi:hypothetical protein